MVFQIGILQEPSIDFWARELTIDEHLEPNDFLTKIFKIPKQQLIWHIFSMSAIRKNCACFLLLQTFVTKIKYLNNQIGNLIHRIILPLSTSVYQHFDFVNQLEINWSILLLSDHVATTLSHENYWSHHRPSDFTNKYIQNMSQSTL